MAAAKGALAPGLMVAPAAAGGVEIVVCSAHNPGGLMVLTASGELVDPADLPDTEELDDPCPFATPMPNAFVAAPVEEPAAPVFALVASAFPSVSVAVGRGLAAPPPPGRAPPLFR